MSLLDERMLASARETIGRVDRQAQILDAESLRRFAVVVGADSDVRARPPVLGHWCWFLPTPADAEIGPDGHPARGGFLPSIEALPRRMFASTEIEFHQAFALDTPGEAIARIADVRHKSGRSGDLVFVDIERSYLQAERLRVSERQTVVYRAAENTAPLVRPLEVAAAVSGEVWTPAAVNLFRFSAVTFNGHRIHYDLPYATGVELYPSLIVHGPFIAAKLAELAVRAGPLASFQFRAQAPCFVDQPIRLVHAGADEFHAVRCDGVTATIAKVGYR